MFCYPGSTGPLLSETENFELSRMDAFKSRRILQVDAAGKPYLNFLIQSISKIANALLRLSCFDPRVWLICQIFSLFVKLDLLLEQASITKRPLF